MQNSLLLHVSCPMSNTKLGIPNLDLNNFIIYFKFIQAEKTRVNKIHKGIRTIHCNQKTVPLRLQCTQTV